jgi:hypothetical protein
MELDTKDVFKHLPNVPDLNGQITILSYKPIYSGPYSCIYSGKLRRNDETVCSLYQNHFLIALISNQVTVVVKVLNHVRGTKHKTMLRVSSAKSLKVVLIL